MSISKIEKALVKLEERERAFEAYYDPSIKGSGRSVRHRYADSLRSDAAHRPASSLGFGTSRHAPSIYSAQPDSEHLSDDDVAIVEDLNEDDFSGELAHNHSRSNPNSTEKKRSTSAVAVRNTSPTRIRTDVVKADRPDSAYSSEQLRLRIASRPSTAASTSASASASTAGAAGQTQSSGGRFRGLITNMENSTWEGINAHVAHRVPAVESTLMQIQEKDKGDRRSLKTSAVDPTMASFSALKSSGSGHNSSSAALPVRPATAGVVDNLMPELFGAGGNSASGGSGSAGSGIPTLTTAGSFRKTAGAALAGTKAFSPNSTSTSASLFGAAAATLVQQSQSGMAPQAASVSSSSAVEERDWSNMEAYFAEKREPRKRSAVQDEAERKRRSLHHERTEQERERNDDEAHKFKREYYSMYVQLDPSQNDPAAMYDVYVSDLNATAGSGSAHKGSNSRVLRNLRANNKCEIVFSEPDNATMDSVAVLGCGRPEELWGHTVGVQVFVTGSTDLVVDNVVTFGQKNERTEKQRRKEDRTAAAYGEAGKAFGRPPSRQRPPPEALDLEQKAMDRERERERESEVVLDEQDRRSLKTRGGLFVRDDSDMLMQNADDLPTETIEHIISDDWSSLMDASLLESGTGPDHHAGHVIASASNNGLKFGSLSSEGASNDAAAVARPQSAHLRYRPSSAAGKREGPQMMHVNMEDDPQGMPNMKKARKRSAHKSSHHVPPAAGGASSSAAMSSHSSSGQVVAVDDPFLGRVQPVIAGRIGTPAGGSGRMFVKTSRLTEPLQADVQPFALVRRPATRDTSRSQANPYGQMVDQLRARNRQLEESVAELQISVAEHDRRPVTSISNSRR